MFSFFTGGAAQNLKEPNQQQLKAQIKNAVKKVCPLCNNFSVELVAYGDGVIPTLTCSKCELRAVGNQNSRLATNLMSTEAFSDNLARELTEYGTTKLRPNNPEKANSEAYTQSHKKTLTQIDEVKQTFKKLKVKASEKLTDLYNASESSNKVPLFEKLNELSQSKKPEQVGDGKMFIKQTIVTDSLHFYDQHHLDESNRRTNEHIKRVEQISQISLSELNELIGYIQKLGV